MSVIEDAVAMVDKSRPDIAAVLRTLPITFSELPEDEVARYVYNGPSHPDEKPHVLINQRLIDQSNVDELSFALLHEGTHALDDVNGTLPHANESYDDVVVPEIRAFNAAFDVIDTLYPLAKYPNGIPGDDTVIQHMNEQLALYRNGTLDDAVAFTYSPVGQFIRVLGL